MVRGAKSLVAVSWLNQAASYMIVTNRLFEKYKLHLLSTHYDPACRTSFDRLFYQNVLKHWLAKEYYAEKDPVVRERKKAILMKSGSASWASTYDEEPFALERPLTTGLTMGEAVPLYLKLKSHIENCTGRENRTIVQIGVGSGRELAWFAKQFPTIKCVGADAFSGAVDHARKRYRLSNLEFHVLPLERANELLEDQRSKHVFFYTSGLFHFVQPEFVVNSLKYISTFQNLDLFISEPVSLPKLDKDAFPKNSVRRIKPLSWTHNYPTLVKRNNLIIQEFILTNHPYDGNPTELTSVNCFIRAKPSTAG